MNFKIDCNEIYMWILEKFGLLEEIDEPCEKCKAKKQK